MSDIKGLDPRMFQPSQSDPEMEQLNAEVEKTFTEMPPVHTLPPQVLRDAREQGAGIWGAFKILDEVKTRRIQTPGGDVEVRIYNPGEPDGVYLHIHGGGFVLNRAHYYDEHMASIAKACQVVAISVDYRLAPENPYPAAPDDCEAVAVWLADQAAVEFGTDSLVIGGESAGANLAAVTLLRMRDHHGFSGFRAAVLSYGVFDLALTPSCRRWGERPLVLTTPLMQWFHAHYVSEDKYDDPDVSPLYADLSGLPPAIFTIGTQDPLIDDSLFMYSRWVSAGNPAQLDVYPRAIHGFNFFPLKVADRANQRITDFIGQALKG